jgi:hypothetical protein
MFELETRIYCQDCLYERDVTLDDVSGAIREVTVVGQFLNDPNCLFHFEKIAEDGFCCFRILENFACQRLGLKGGDSAKFCRAVASAAVTSSEAAAKEIGGIAVENGSLTQLKLLARHAKPVDALHNGLWKRLEVQHVLNGYATIFKDRVSVNVYQATSKGLVQKTNTYGNGSLQLDMLQWDFTQHYDRLVPKK